MKTIPNSKSWKYILINKNITAFVKDHLIVILI